MPAETISKDEILKAIGTKGAVVATPTTSLDSTTKILNMLDKPVVSKYVDRILGRVIKPLPAENPPAAGGAEQEAPATPTTRTPAHKPPAQASAQSGAQAVESLQIFVSMQDKEITLGQFGDWIEKNKERLAKAIDKGLVMQNKAATQKGASDATK